MKFINSDDRCEGLDGMMKRCRRIVRWVVGVVLEGVILGKVF